LFLRFIAGLLRREPGPIESGVAEGPTAAYAAPPPPRERMATEVQIDPDKAAAVLRTWLSSDESLGDNGGVTGAAGQG